MVYEDNWPIRCSAKQRLMGKPSRKLDYCLTKSRRTMSLPRRVRPLPHLAVNDETYVSPTTSSARNHCPTDDKLARDHCPSDDRNN